MNKINGLSLDIEKQNINKIKELFPEAVEEGKINFEVLRAFLGDAVDDSKEKYQFTWNGKANSIKLAQAPSSATLRPCKDKSKNWDTTENLYIEGDNLEVLKQLQKTYYGKIKMIYIDPPYNTGNDFVYKDSFSNSLENYKNQTNQASSSNPETSGRFHTDWLNMMYPRLLLAKNLLSDDGVIFISIDDNEVFNLKKICDEIFGLSDFRSMVTVIANPGGRDYGGIAKTTEYILIYSKSENTILQKVPDENHVFEMRDEIGPFELRELRNRNTVFNDKNRPNLCYPFYLDPNNIDEFGLYHLALEPDEKHCIKVMPMVSNGVQTVWRWGMNEKSRPNLNINVKGKKKQDGTYMIVEKYRDEKIMVKNTWTDKKFRTENGSVQVRNIMGGKGIFDYPKPIEIPSLALLMSTDKNSLILDFFSGSATTAHAVMKLNAEDGGNRKFIMVQLPESYSEEAEAFKAGYKNICETGEERIRRAGEQIKADWKKEHPSDGLFANDEKFNVDIGFKVFKLDSTNIVPWDSSEQYNEDNLFNLNDVFKMDRSNEDVLYEIMLKYGVFDKEVEEIDVNGKTMYRVGKRYMIVCLEDKVTEADIKAIGELFPKTVIFKEKGFADDNAKINAVYNLEKAGVEDIKCI